MWIVWMVGIGRMGLPVGCSVLHGKMIALMFGYVKWDIAYGV